MIDRQAAPAFKTLSKIDVIKASESKLQNGIKVYSLNAGSQEIVKLEFVFKAGMFYQSHPLIASATNSLLESGTKSFSANELSDGIDFYGSFIEFGVGQDYACVTLFSLNKYLNETLKFVEEILKYPVFNAEEFKIHIQNKKQKHFINSQKVDVLVRRNFSELIFGHNHPYGVNVKDNDFERINMNEIQSFCNKHYQSKNCTIVASGCLPNNLNDTLNKFFGENDWGNQPQLINSNSISVETTKQRINYFEREDAIQSAIRIGRVTPNKTNPDIFHLQLMNCILGGYFGSRLMANIREDKGYTYGIGSGITSLVHTGYFFISTEVGAEVTNQALEEIYKEIKLLRENLVSDAELETVRNYMLGQFLRSVDGPFALADKFKSIWEFGMDYSYFDKYFNAIKSAKPDHIREMANKYLQENDLIECVVGKK